MRINSACTLAFVQEFWPFPAESYLSLPRAHQRERMTYISSKFPYSSRRESNFARHGDFRILLRNLKGKAERRREEISESREQCNEAGLFVAFISWSLASTLIILWDFILLLILLTHLIPYHSKYVNYTIPTLFSIV